MTVIIPDPDFECLAALWIEVVNSVANVPTLARWRLVVQFHGLFFLEQNRPFRRPSQ